MTESTRPPIPQGNGQWEVAIRTGVLLRVCWIWHDAGQRVEVELLQLAKLWMPKIPVPAVAISVAKRISKAGLRLLLFMRSRR